MGVAKPYLGPWLELCQWQKLVLGFWPAHPCSCFPPWLASLQAHHHIHANFAHLHICFVFCACINALIYASAHQCSVYKVVLDQDCTLTGVSRMHAEGIGCPSNVQRNSPLRLTSLLNTLSCYRARV